MPDTTPAPVDPALRQRVHAALRAVGEGDSDPGTGSDYGDQTAAVLAALAPELARAEQAETALDRVHAQAVDWSRLASPGDVGMTPSDTAFAEAGRIILGIIGQPEENQP